MRFILLHLPFWALMIILPGALAFSKAASSRNKFSLPYLPNNPDAMIRQAADAVQAAFASDENINRQTIRLALSESMYSNKEESFVADRAIGWQGGPQETQRYLLPLTRQLLQACVGDDDKSGLTPKIQQQTLLDFDGSFLMNAQSPMGAAKDSLALAQPNTDDYYRKLIRQMEDEFSDSPGKAKRLFLIVNPAWKDDASSWGFFQAREAQAQILDRYPVTYALDQFIVKGNRISLLRCWPHDCCVYLTATTGSSSNKDSTPQLLGHFAQRPTYAAVEQLLLQTR